MRRSNRASRLGLICLTALALPFSPAAAQDAVYDDGGSHVLSAYPVAGTAYVEVRDGPGGAPTQLDVSIGVDLYDVYLDAYGSSTINLLSIGYGFLSTHDDAQATSATPGASAQASGRGSANA